VVLIDLLRIPAPELDHGEALIKRQEVSKALAQIIQIAHVSHPAKGAVRVITQLLCESTNLMRGCPYIAYIDAFLVIS
jgi:hypothetical protein